MNPTPDSGQDPWLLEALRHAPDTELGVPVGVRDGILRAARLAAAPSSPATPVMPWWRVMADVWLRPARLGYSGAFMALLVLGVWGVAVLDPEAGPAPTQQTPQPAEQNEVAALPKPASVLERRSTDVDAAQGPRLPTTRTEPAKPSAPFTAKAAPSAEARVADAAPQAEAAADALTLQGRVPLGAAAAPVAADPVGQLLRRLASDPASAEMRWASPGYDAAHAAAQTDWLRQLQEATGGRWQRAEPATVPEPRLLLSLRSAPVAGFAFTGTPTTAWLSVGGTTYRADLPDDAAARLERLRAAW